jgi:hypothetical protein
MKMLVRLFTFLGVVTAALAQWPSPTFSPSNITILTTGSIAYVKFTYSWSCPQELGKTDPIINGTNVQQNVYLWDNYNNFCPAVFPQPVYSSQATIVIGQFQPGNYIYKMITTAPGEFPQGSSITIPFTIQSPPPGNVSIFTTGSIAYLKFKYSYSCPQELGKTAPVINGTNVQQNVFLWDNFNTICTDEFPPLVFNAEATVVIGQFEPGNYLYRLNTNAPGGLPQSPSILIPFTVQVESTLKLLPANGPGIAFRVVGTSNLTYRVLSGTTLTNWANIRTAFNAPFTVTNQAGDLRFYKVEVRDEITTFPGF